MMNWSKHFTTYLLVLLLAVVAGCSASPPTPRLVLVTKNESLNASEIDKQITQPLSTHMLRVTGVTESRGISYPGISIIQMIFTENTDPFTAQQLIQYELNNRLPNIPMGTGSPFIIPQNDQNNRPVGWITIKGKYNYQELQELATTVQDSLNRRFNLMPVSQSQSDLLVKIILQPHQMEAMGIPFKDVQDGLKKHELTSMDELLHYQFKPDYGHLIKLRDIADIQQALAEPTGYFREDGQPVIAIPVLPSPFHAATFDHEQIHVLLKRLQPQIEKGMHLTYLPMDEKVLEVKLDCWGCTDLETTRELSLKVADQLHQHLGDQVQHAIAIDGQDETLTSIGYFPHGPYGATLWLQLKDDKALQKEQVQEVRQVFQDMPGLNVSVRRIDESRYLEEQLILYVLEGDLADPSDPTMAVEAKLQHYEPVTVHTVKGMAIHPELVYEIDHTRAANFKFQKPMLMQQMQDYLNRRVKIERPLHSQNRDGSDTYLDIVLVLNLPDEHLDLLPKLHLRNSVGGIIRLGHVCAIEKKVTPLEVYRHDGTRGMVIELETSKGMIRELEMEIYEKVAPSDEAPMDYKPLLTYY